MEKHDTIFSSYKDKQDAELRLILTRIIQQKIAATKYFLVLLHVLQRTSKSGAVLLGSVLTILPQRS